MTGRVRIGLSEDDRRVICQAYEQAKAHPERRATAPDEDDLPVWNRAVHNFVEKGYADLRGFSFAQTGGIFWFTPKGMRAAELICGSAEGYTELLLPVGRRDEGYTDMVLTGKQLDAMLVIDNPSEIEERNRNYTLYDSEEGLRIYEEEWLIIGSVEVQPGQAYAELRDVQNRLYTIEDARADDSAVMKTVLEHFADHL